MQNVFVMQTPVAVNEMLASASWTPFASLSFTAYVAAFAAAALVSFASLLRTRDIADRDTRHALVALLLTSGVWATSHVGFLLAATPGAKRLFYVGGLIVGFMTVGAWMYFCSAYTGRTLHRNRAVRGVALLLLAIVAGIKLTNPLHELYYTLDYTLVPFPHLTVRHHLFYWLIMGISYALASVGYFMLVEYFGRLSQNAAPIAILVGLTGLPPVLNIIGYASPWLLDITYEPIGVAAFAIGALHVYRGSFQAVGLVGEHDEPAVVTSDDGRLWDFNASAANLFSERDLPAALGEPLDRAIPPLAGVGTTGRAVVTVDTDEGTRHFQVAENRFGAGGTRSGRLLLLADITERKRAEEALRRERNLLQRIFDASPEAILMLDAEGAITFASRQAEAVLGLTPAATRGRAYDDPRWQFETSAGGPFDRDMLPFAVVRRTGEPVYESEFAIRGADGARRQVSVSGAPLMGEEGAFEGAVLIVQDITERRDLERQLRHAQKMETVGTLAGGIAHDFNNILHSVQTYVQMATDDTRAAGEAATADLLEHASTGLGRAGGLVEKLLTFSRQDASGDRERVDVSAAVREAVDLASPSLPEGIEVRTALGKDCLTRAESGQIHQVATNLITNAGQAMEEVETRVLDVDVHRIDVGEDLARQHLGLEPGRYVRLSISDTGPGMDTKTQARIFDPFFTTKERGQQKGTGLGLSMVHGIVKETGGEISVRSQPGEGTTFDVYLPQAEARDASPDGETAAGEPAAEGLTAEEVAAAAPRARLLLVDDDAEIAELQAQCLRNEGYEVTTARDARDALHAVEDDLEAFDLVVTDYSMPEQNGLDLTRRLRESNFARPVVLMSGLSAQVSAGEMESAGVDAFLRKPIGEAEMTATIDQLVESAL
jgi:PAS domain S-box-containing protein